MRWVLFVISLLVISRLIGTKTIKILKKEVIYKTDGKSTHLIRPASLVDINGMHCGTLHYSEWIK